ncbi:MAG: GNAT family N-acetyltransferase [Acidobacteria bacterium]|nr:GNAT family N-acetyltransferase [Acidobacteriota bacterium]
MATIRPELEADRAAIFEVNQEVFPTDAEARLVDTLRAKVAPTTSLVAEVDGTIVGHIFFSPVTIDGVGGEGVMLGLAPMAVREKFQRQGIGRQLVEAGLAACQRANVELVFVLGHPDYYPKLGFAPVASFGLHYADPKLDVCFFVKELLPGALHGAKGTVAYHPAFDEAFGADQGTEPPS